jgi:hypothetical protein
MKLMLFRTPGPFPVLRPVTALMADPTGEMVVLQEEVMTPDGPTNTVSAQDCLEFDADLMCEVNALLTRSMDSLNAAKQMLEVRSRRVAIDLEKPADDETIFH